MLKIVNPSGQTVVSFTYDAWGNFTLTPNSEADRTEITFAAAFNPIFYRGYLFDYETGLYYLQSRYYNPETGRFANADHVELFPYFDRYTFSTKAFQYAQNNPVLKYEPTGFAAKDYPGFKYKRKGVFSVNANTAFLNKNTCLSFANQVIDEYGNSIHFGGMFDERIAAEVYAHAVAYYSSSALKKLTLYKTIPYVKKAVDYIIKHSNPIDVNYNESFTRVLVFYLIWEFC